MSHAEETNQRWEQMAWAESICDRWETFFTSLVDEPNRAMMLCSLGIIFVSAQGINPPRTGSDWLSLFGALSGKPQLAKDLCAIGLEMIFKGIPRETEVIRDQVRAQLMTCFRTASA